MGTQQKVGSCDTTGMADAEIQWLNAIIQDDGDLLRSILNDSSSSKSDTSLPGLSKQPRMLKHIRAQCVMTSSPYIPDNAVCLAAMFNSNNVLKVMMAFDVPFTQTNSHKNTFLHCMIAYASTQSEEYESQYIKTITWVKSSIPWDDFRGVILTENSDGLRPLELAAHLGTFILFTCLFETEGVYLSKKQELNLYTVQYYDITEYVTGNRYYTSPVYTIANLDHCKLDQKSTRDIFNNNPMVTWISAVIHANMPFMVIYAFFRITVILTFWASVVIIKRTNDHSLLKNTTKDIDCKYCVSYMDVKSTALLLLSFFNSVVTVIVLVFDLSSVFLDVINYKTVKWSHKLVSRRKNTVSNMVVAGMASWASLIGSLTMSANILKQHLMDKGNMCFSCDSIDAMVLVGVLASIWDILFFMQLVPGLNLYVIAVQQILTAFLSFSVLLAFFFLSYSTGFYLLAENPIDFGSSLYETFRLMLNMIDFSNSNSASQIFHAAFIFLLVHLLLNVLIAIFISSFEYVHKNHIILARVQSLNVYFYLDSMLSRLMKPIYNNLRKKHLVFEDGKIYVTKVTMKPVHMNFDIVDNY